MKHTHQQEFLKTFFVKKDMYQEQEVNGFVLVYSWNGGTKQWQVGIYTQESFKKYKEYGLFRK